MTANIWKDAEVASGYLTQHSVAIPDRPRQLEVLLRVVRYAQADPHRFLDLGCGEGVLLSTLLHAYPAANGVAVDFSPTMLEAARERLAPFARRVQFIEADLADPRWRTSVTGRFSAIASGLAIHHLSDHRKRQLYGEVFELLAPGGVFINTEHVSSETKLLEQISNDMMAEYLLEIRQSRGEPVSLEVVRREFLERPDRAANILCPTERQCQWLREIGFLHVDCYWKYFELAIFGGFRKQNSVPEELYEANNSGQRMIEPTPNLQKPSPSGC